mgnify:CR=1 FL=1
MVDLYPVRPASFANAEPVTPENPRHAERLGKVMESLPYPEKRNIFVIPMGAKFAIFV